MIADVAEWSSVLAIRQSDWCCTVFSGACSNPVERGTKHFSAQNCVCLCDIYINRDQVGKIKLGDNCIVFKNFTASIIGDLMVAN